jgi:hypothetical protein
MLKNTFQPFFRLSPFFADMAHFLLGIRGTFDIISPLVHRDWLTGIFLAMRYSQCREHAADGGMSGGRPIMDFAHNLCYQIIIIAKLAQKVPYGP